LSRWMTCSQRLASNVDLGEVQSVNLKDLKGGDDVLRNLEINIILPLENDDLASRFKLRLHTGLSERWSGSKVAAEYLNHSSFLEIRLAAATPAVLIFSNNRRPCHRSPGSNGLTCVQF